MKRSVFMLMIMVALLWPMAANAQEGGGLFGWGLSSTDSEYDNNGRLFDPVWVGGYNIAIQQFGSDFNGGFNISTQQFGQEAPIGNSWLVLTIAGVAYAFRKRKNNNK